MPATTNRARHRVPTASIGLATASADTGALSASLPVVAKDARGYLGFATYRYCDGGTGSTVMLDVTDFFGGDHTRCVGPGVTDLQPGIRWVVIDAYWNGGVGCIPGLNGCD